MYKTEQEQFWAGEFGDDYASRNQGAKSVASAIATFSQTLRRTQGIASVLELGANIGLNMLALRQLLPDAALNAVEINASAYERLRSIPGVNAVNESLLNPLSIAPVDLSFTKGVLIHVSPDALATAYDRLYESSRRYIAMIEYYNITPMEVPYRGHSGRLFKRDWCADMLARHPDLQLVDYGFVYHGDANFADDDVTWFMLEKR